MVEILLINGPFHGQKIEVPEAKTSIYLRKTEGVEWGSVYEYSIWNFRMGGREEIYRIGLWGWDYELAAKTIRNMNFKPLKK